MESPLYVLSKAASMIHEAEHVEQVKDNGQGCTPEEAKDKDKEDNMSDDNDSTDAPCSPSKINPTKERREKRIAERRNGVLLMNNHSRPKDKIMEMQRESETQQIESRTKISPEMPGEIKPVTRECKSPVRKPTPLNYDYHKNSQKQSYGIDLKRELERNHFEAKLRPKDSIIPDYSGLGRFPTLPPPPLISLHPSHSFPWLPPYPVSLPMVSRPSVITMASCGRLCPSSPYSCCHCMNLSCCMNSLSSSSSVKTKREVMSTVPAGFDSPTVEDHFRKSLGKDYDHACQPVESLNSVDEHFARALGKSWNRVKYQHLMEPALSHSGKVLSS